MLPRHKPAMCGACPTCRLSGLIHTAYKFESVLMCRAFWATQGIAGACGALLPA